MSMKINDHFLTFQQWGILGFRGRFSVDDGPHQRILSDWDPKGKSLLSMNKIGIKFKQKKRPIFLIGRLGGEQMKKLLGFVFCIRLPYINAIPLPTFKQI